MLDFQNALALLRSMKPGECLEISNHDLAMMSFPMSILGNDGWTAKDWLLERIIGSSYEFRYVENLIRNTVTFQRLSEPLRDGRRAYVSPDRRDLFKQDYDGFWSLKKR